MLKLRISILAISLGMIVASAALAAPDEPASIRTAIDNQEAAWNRGDIDQFMNGYTHSADRSFISGDKLTRGWQTVRDRYAKKYDAPKKWARSLSPT